MRDQDIRKKQTYTDNNLGSYDLINAQYAAVELITTE